ncbi:MAG TPA: DUF1376 domain-containing protein [Pyrinomonadaceae bacterium]|jgi:uncharacterized protein YdaU (DUF1376 family)
MPKDNGRPAFLLYPDDFTSDGKVEAMSTEEVGAYFLLLCKSWREKPVASIPDDDATLARWARLSVERWMEAKPRVLAAFKFGTDGRWHQKRLKREYDALRAKQRARHEAAQKAAQKRWGNQKE